MLYPENALPDISDLLAQRKIENLKLHLVNNIWDSMKYLIENDYIIHDQLDKENCICVIANLKDRLDKIKDMSNAERKSYFGD